MIFLFFSNLVNKETDQSRTNEIKVQRPNDDSLINSFKNERLTQSFSSTQPSRRPKRSYSLERNIEILIVIDILMNKYHGDNLENYIFTIMSTVSNHLEQFLNQTLEWCLINR